MVRMYIIGFVSQLQMFRSTSALASTQIKIKTLICEYKSQNLTNQTTLTVVALPYKILTLTGAK